MFKWKKKGRIFNPAEIKGIPWLNEFAQAPSVLIFEDKIRVYFSCRPPVDNDGQYVSYTAYVDLKRNNIFEVLGFSDSPILELGQKGTFDEFGVYPTSVIKNDHEIRAYYGGWTRCESVPFNVGIGLAVSNDSGKTFNRIGNGPVIPYSPDEPFILSGPKIRRFNDLWYLFYIAGKKWIPTDSKPEPVYQIRMATSSDGLTWNKHNKNLIPIKIEEDECQASPDVFFHNNLYHMFFCYRYSLGFRSKEKGYRIGYAYSKDLLNWRRDDSMVGIDVSDDGWDSEMISYPHVFELDGRIYMFYLGNSVGRFGFGVAELENYEMD